MASLSSSFGAAVLAAGLLAIAPAPAPAQSRLERLVEKQFTVDAPGTLRVETAGGAIRVSPTTDSVVRIVAKQRIRASTEAEADELLKKLELTLEQQGNDVRAVARYERRGPGFHFGSWPPVQVDFEIHAPAAFATELSTSGGGITVGDLTGQVRARTSGGSITLGRLGGAVDASTSGGNISLAEAGGPVDLKTSGGNLSVGRVSGPASLSTSGGSIKIESAEGRLRAHTSGGSIRAGIAGALRDECSLSTSGGSVRVAVDRSAAFRLDASTSGGHVDAEGLTLTLEKSGRGRLAGTVNGGGPLLKVRTSGGSISVRPL
jgi:hypothetical protein